MGPDVEILIKCTAKSTEFGLSIVERSFNGGDLIPNLAIV